MSKYPYVEAEYGKPHPSLDALWPEEHCPDGYAGQPKFENYHLARVQYQVRTSLPETPGSAIKDPHGGSGRIYWWVTKITGYIYYTADWVESRYKYWRTNVEKHHQIEERITPKRWSNSIHKVVRDSYEAKIAEMEKEGDQYLDWYEDFWMPECICLPLEARR